MCSPEPAEERPGRPQAAARPARARLHDDVAALQHAPELAPDLQVLLERREHQALALLHRRQLAPPGHKCGALLRVHRLRALVLAPRRPPRQLQPARPGPRLRPPASVQPFTMVQMLAAPVTQYKRTAVLREFASAAAPLRGLAAAAGRTTPSRAAAVRSGHSRRQSADTTDTGHWWSGAHRWLLRASVAARSCALRASSLASTAPVLMTTASPRSAAKSRCVSSACVGQANDVTYKCGTARQPITCTAACRPNRRLVHSTSLCPV